MGENVRKNEGKKRMVGRVILIIVFLIALSFSSVYGEETKEKVAKKGDALEEVKKELTLEQALQSSLENNLKIKKALLDLDNAKIAYEKAKANNLQTESIIDMKKADLDWQKAQNNFEKVEQESQLEVISEYINLKNLKEELPLKEENVKLSQGNLKRVKEKVKTGIAGEIDKLSACIDLQMAEDELNKTQRDLEKTSKNLILDTGIKNIGQFFLTTDFSEPTVNQSLTLKDFIEKALKNRKEIKFAQKDIEIAELEIEKLKMEDAPSLDIGKAVGELTLSRIAFEQEKIDIEKEVREKFNQLKNLEDELKLQALKFERGKKDFENAQEQFKLGLITSDELSSEKISYQEIKLNCEKSKGDYFLAYQEFLVSLGEKINLGSKNED